MITGIKSPRTSFGGINNPTENTGLNKPKSREFSAVGANMVNTKNLKILCTKCSKFEKDFAINKVYMDYNERNELYRCHNNPNHVYSEQQIKYALRLELPEHIYYDKKKDIQDIKNQRKTDERFVLRAINEDSPTDMISKKRVKTVDTKKISTTNNRESFTGS